LGIPINTKIQISSTNDSLQIVDINCDELDNYTKEYVIGKLRFKPGAKITYKQLEAGMNTLMRQKISELLTIMLEPKPSG
jgi:NTE family protein